MSGFTVTSEDVKGLSGHVSTGSQSIQEQLSRLQSEVSSVVGGEWMGVASGAFEAKYEEWNRSAAGLKDALDSISVMLAQAAGKYQENEDAVRGSWAH